jgi:hypothetical protein
LIDAREDEVWKSKEILLNGSWRGEFCHCHCCCPAESNMNVC